MCLSGRLWKRARSTWLCMYVYRKKYNMYKVHIYTKSDKIPKTSFLFISLDCRQWTSTFTERYNNILSSFEHKMWKKESKGIFCIITDSNMKHKRTSYTYVILSGIYTIHIKRYPKICLRPMEFFSPFHNDN